MSTFKSFGALTRHHAVSSHGVITGRTPLLSGTNRAASGTHFVRVGAYLCGPTSRFSLTPSGGALMGGTVKDHNGSLAARKVNIHAQDTGELLGSVMSHPTTGVWSFATDREAYAVALDDTASSRRAIVFDRIE